jgi:glucose dehydrogenase
MKHIRILVLILCACFVSVAWGEPLACKFPSPWGQFHRLNMQRFNPCEKVLNVKSVKNLSLKWSYATGGEVVSSPIVANGILYAGSENRTFYALNVRTGHLLWSFPTGSQVQSTAAVANGVVYFDSFDGNVYALNARTGHKLWSYYEGGTGQGSSPAVLNGVVYVGGGWAHNNVHALDATTGTYCGPLPRAAVCCPRPPWRMAWFMSARGTTRCTR